MFYEIKFRKNIIYIYYSNILADKIVLIFISEEYVRYACGMTSEYLGEELAVCLTQSYRYMFISVGCYYCRVLIIIIIMVLYVFIMIGNESTQVLNPLHC